MYHNSLKGISFGEKNTVNRKTSSKRISYGWKKGIGPVLYVETKKKKICFCLCHHKKDRTVKFFGLEKYLCSRDLGILFGSILGEVLYFSGVFVNSFFLILLALPMVVDGGTQFFGWRESNNYLRLITGFMFGVFMPLVVDYYV